MYQQRLVDLWIPAKAAAALVSTSANSNIQYVGGGTLWVPTAPEQDVTHGYRFSASGTPQQLQQLCNRLLQECMCFGEFYVSSLSAECSAQCWYLEQGGHREGPLFIDQLLQLLGRGLCQHNQLVCHGPSGVWLPLSQVLELTEPIASCIGSNEAVATAQHPGPLLESKPAATRPQQKTVQKAVESGAHAASPPAAVQPADDEEYGSASRRPSKAWLQRVHALEEATKARQAQQRQLTAAGPPTKQQNPCITSAAGQPETLGRTSPYIGDTAGGLVDTDIQGVSAEDVLEAVSLLRGDQTYLDQLHQAVDMDWEPSLLDVSLVGHVEAGDSATAGALLGPLQVANAADSRHTAVDRAPSHPQSGSNRLNGAAPKLEQDKLLLLTLVLDTNVLLDVRSRHFIQQLFSLQRRQGSCITLSQEHIHGCQGEEDAAVGNKRAKNTKDANAPAVCVQAVVPWTVLVELDRLKTRDSTVASQAQKAVVLVREEALHAQQHACSGQGSTQQDGQHVSTWVLQSLQEFRRAAQEHDFGVTSSSLVADDRILQCALSHLQQHQQNRACQAGAACQSGALLLTNDKILQLKAHANNVAAAGWQDLSALNTTAQVPGGMPAAVSALWQMLRLAGVGTLDLPDTTMCNRLSSAAPLSTHQQQQQQQHHHHNHNHQRQHKRHHHHCQHQHQSHSGLPADQLACQAASQHSTKPPAEPKQPQPSSNSGAAASGYGGGGLNDHHCDSSDSGADISAAVGSFLTFLRLSMARRVEGWFQSDHEDLWQFIVVVQPPWNNVDFLDVLKHHWRSTIQLHLPKAALPKSAHLENTVSYLFKMAKQLDKHNVARPNLKTLPSNIGVRIMELLIAFGEQQAADQVEDALIDSQAALFQSAATSSHGNTHQAVKVPNMHAQVAAAEATAAAAATAAATPPVVSTSHIATGLQVNTQLSPAAQHPDTHHCPAAQGLPAGARALTAAAAAVTAPQLVRPFLTLGQLLSYTVALLQAVLPLWRQLLLLLPSGSAATVAFGGTSAQHAAVHAEFLQQGVRLEEHLRGIVQQLWHVARQQQQWQQHGEILQLGLLVVQLCSLLLGDHASGTAVAEQLRLHAADFASDGAAYLTGQEVGSADPSFRGADDVKSASLNVVTQQLTEALQGMQEALMQAAQHS